jgi:flagellar hook-associated protein FlgK
MDSMSIAGSGLNAAVAQLNATANNIANVNSPGYQAQQVNLVDNPTGGVTVDGTESTGQSVDLANEMVNMQKEKLFYGANAMVLRVSAQMSGTLLNILDNSNRDQYQDQDDND